MVLLGLKVALTPLGRPETESATVPLNPPWSRTVMVVLSLLPPCTRVRLLGDGAILKLGVGAVVSALMRFCPFGLPHPVTRSYPATAL